MGSSVCGAIRENSSFSKNKQRQISSKWLRSPKTDRATTVCESKSIETPSLRFPLRAGGTDKCAHEAVPLAKRGNPKEPPCAVPLAKRGEP